MAGHIWTLYTITYIDMQRFSQHYMEFSCVTIPGQYLNNLFYIHGYVEDTCNCVRIIKVADLQSNYYQEVFSTFFHLYLEKYVVLILSEKTITTIVYHTYWSSMSFYVTLYIQWVFIQYQNVPYIFSESVFSCLTRFFKHHGIVNYCRISFKFEKRNI